MRIGMRERGIRDFEALLKESIEGRTYGANTIHEVTIVGDTKRIIVNDG